MGEVNAHAHAPAARRVLLSNPDQARRVSARSAPAVLVAAVDVVLGGAVVGVGREPAGRGVGADNDDVREAVLGGVEVVRRRIDVQPTVARGGDEYLVLRAGVLDGGVDRVAVEATGASPTRV